jgi:hypothetical protein
MRLVIRNVKSAPLLFLLSRLFGHCLDFLLLLLKAIIIVLDNSRVVSLVADFISDGVDCILPVVELGLFFFRLFGLFGLDDDLVFGSFLFGLLLSLNRLSLFSLLCFLGLALALYD